MTSPPNVTLTEQDFRRIVLVWAKDTDVGVRAWHSLLALWFRDSIVRDRDDYIWRREAERNTRSEDLRWSRDIDSRFARKANKLISA